MMMVMMSECQLQCDQQAVVAVGGGGDKSAKREQDEYEVQ